MKVENRVEIGDQLSMESAILLFGFLSLGTSSLVAHIRGAVSFMYVTVRPGGFTGIGEILYRPSIIGERRLKVPHETSMQA
jgi:hypothetical protein